MELFEVVFEEISLDGYKRGHNAKKFNCPGCGKKRFVKYVNTVTNEYLPDIYGRCDREQGCAYLLSPYDDIKAAKKAHRENNPLYVPPERTYSPPPVQPRERKLCSRETMQQTLGAYHLQPLYLWFCSKFGQYTANDVFAMYNVGTAKDGATLFWQVDSQLQVRTAQKIHYNGFNRDKNKPPTRLFKVEDDYEPCFFGEHLLHIARQRNLNPMVCIVESEKTAMIANIYLPTIPTKNGERDAIWLACSGSNGMTDAKISALKDFDVLLMPDYSYLNRAQWGAAEMRKAKRSFTVGDGKVVERMVADPNGTPDPTYQNAKERILHHAKAKSVQVFDSAPDRIDGGDIGDFLVESGLPVVVPEEPDYTKLYVLPMTGEKVAENGVTTPARYIDPYCPKPGENGYEKYVLDGMVFKNPILAELITTLDLQLVTGNLQ